MRVNLISLRLTDFINKGVLGAPFSIAEFINKVIESVGSFVLLIILLYIAGAINQCQKHYRYC